MTRGNFLLNEVVTALDNNAGNDEIALLELQKNQLKPFLMRIYGPSNGLENENMPSSLEVANAGEYCAEICSPEQINKYIFEPSKLVIIH